MDNSHNMSYQAGQTKGQTQEKGNQLMDKAGNAAQSAMESMQQTGQQMQAKAQGAVDAAKNATVAESRSRNWGPVLEDCRFLSHLQRAEIQIREV
ncbi:hypothetical protein ACJIZ3_014794 [Penstemon smallii]|uniref:Uncharacterized protein n=1 Tax=Penstemon smallii TaxID=265156 RepID=A0ABD3RP15_9LAMI